MVWEELTEDEQRRRIDFALQCCDLGMKLCSSLARAGWAGPIKDIPLRILYYQGPNDERSVATVAESE